MTTIPNINVFRNSYRQERIPRFYIGYLHVLWALVVLGAPIIYHLISLKKVEPLEWLVLPATFFFGNFVEYWMHRLPLHRPKLGHKLYRIHVHDHHRFFTNEHPSYDSPRDFHTVLFPAWAQLLASVGVLCIGHFVLAPIFNDRVASLFIFTGIGYFLMYEALHFLHHVPYSGKGHTGILFRLREHHRLHHHPQLMDQANFNVTLPLCDWIFNTINYAPAFQSQRILITGAGSGIGSDLSQNLAMVGAKLALLDIQEDKLIKIKERCEHMGAAEVVTKVVDVTDSASLQQIAEELILSWGGLDVAIAAAGVGAVNPASDFSPEIDKKVMSINYLGTVNTLTPFIKSMTKARSGHLVGICSLAAFGGLPKASSYCASKAAQMVFLESLRVDLKPSGIKVSSIHPGFVETPMTNHDEFKMPFQVSVEKSTQHILKAIYKGKGSYSYPFSMALLSKLGRYLPTSVYDYLMPRLGGSAENPAPKLLSGTDKR